jgi:hypothetical protein
MESLEVGKVIADCRMQIAESERHHSTFAKVQVGKGAVIEFKVE